MSTMMNIFYVPDIQYGNVSLSEEESIHAVKVLRLKPDDPVVLVDGKGNYCEGIIYNTHPKRCMVTIHTVLQGYEKRGYFLHLAVAPPKNGERSDWLVEKATEIGLDVFTPLECRYSERKQTNRERLSRIAVAAMKQSQRAYLPFIDEMRTFQDFIQIPFEGIKVIAHCHTGEKPHLRDLVSSRSGALVLIGPEGDFSPDEVSMAKQYGFNEVTLGPARLRTETAAILACHLAALANL